MKHQKFLLKILLAGWFCFFLSGCAGINYPEFKNQLNTGKSQGILLDVPFVAQKGSFCGPAALSSVLAFWQVPVSQEDIAARIYFHDIRGVLNVDLELFAREKGFWAKSSPGDIQTLEQKLKQGIPVIVLEKLHPYILQRYHYSVVIGISEDPDLVVTHIGTKGNVLRGRESFLRNWNAAGSWMLEIIPPEKVLGDLSGPENLELGVILEKNNELDKALARYQAAAAYGPDQDIAFFNIANLFLKQGKFKEAESSYLKAILLKPDFVPAYNNLADLYLRQGDYPLAEKYVNLALSRAENYPGNFKFYCLDTKAQILFAQGQIKPAEDLYAQSLQESLNQPEPVQRRFREYWNQKWSEAGRKDLIRTE